MFRRDKIRKFIKLLFGLLVILLVLLLGSRIISKAGLFQKTTEKVNEEALVKATVDIGKSFTFQAQKIKKKGTEDVKFTLASAELKDQIRVKGVPKNADSGRQFLLLRLEIENSSTDELSITPSDLIRLVREEGKMFAPDFHNATVIIDPLSVRKDLVSFVVPTTEKNFNFLVGELDGDKETVIVNF